jgi:hypothetical protein
MGGRKREEAGFESFLLRIAESYGFHGASTM